MGVSRPLKNPLRAKARTSHRFSKTEGLLSTDKVCASPGDRCCFLLTFNCFPRCLLALRRKS